MSDQSNSNSSPTSPPSNPAPTTSAPEAPEAPRSLRDTLEEAYNDQNEADAASGQSGRERDNYGRFISKEGKPGVAEPRAPSPDPKISAAQRPPEPAPTGSSTQVPDHWSADLKSAFTKWSPDVQGEFLNRHREMEADYTRKSQASAGAVNFTQAIAPVFNDPQIQASLRQEGMNAAQAVQQWGEFHRRAIHPDQRERVNLLVDLSQRMGLDPALLFATGPQQPPQGLSQQDLADPAIKYFADHLARQQQEMAQQRQRLEQFLHKNVQQQEQQVLQVTQWGIDTFADEKDSSGQPLRPHFDAVIDDIYDLIAAQPGLDLKNAYDKAVWANPEVRKLMIERETRHLQQSSSLDRAKLAARGNTRGLTAPVSKPNAKTGNGSLRDIIEASADEVGFS